MITLTVNKLVGGSIVVGSSGGSSEHADTWYKYANDTDWRTVSIQGALVSNDEMPTSQIPDVMDAVAVDLGTDVTSIGSYAFAWCSSILSLTIPSTVTTISPGAFYGFTNNIAITFEGRTMSEVQGM